MALRIVLALTLVWGIGSPALAQQTPCPWYEVLQWTMDPGPQIPCIAPPAWSPMAGLASCAPCAGNSQIFGLDSLDADQSNCFYAPPQTDLVPVVLPWRRNSHGTCVPFTFVTSERRTAEIRRMPDMRRPPALGSTEAHPIARRPETAPAFPAFRTFMEPRIGPPAGASPAGRPSSSGHP